MGLNQTIRVSIIAILGIVFIGLVILFGVTKAGPGEVAIRVNLMGDNRGVEEIPLETGRILYNRFTQDVFIYPTNMQTGVSKGIQFGSKEGLKFTADIAYAFTLDAEKVPVLYVEHRRPIDVVRDVYLHNAIMMMIVSEAERLDAASIYGTGKSDMMNRVKDRLNQELERKGIKFDYVTFNGNPEAPEQVINAINDQIRATQDAIRAENQLRETEAEAKKKVAEARGIAESLVVGAEAEAESILIKAQAEAEANTILVESIGGAENYVRLKMIEKLGDKIEVMVVPDGSMQLLGLDGLKK